MINNAESVLPMDPEDQLNYLRSNYLVEDPDSESKKLDYLNHSNILQQVIPIDHNALIQRPKLTTKIF